MANYAFLDEDNFVVEIISGIDETELIDGIDPETWYGNFRGQKCKRASYNTVANKHLLGGTPFRKNYPGIGYKYDDVKDAFIPPKPLDSFILDEETCTWVHPIPYPTDGDRYVWDEDSVSWILYIEE